MCFCHSCEISYMATKNCECFWILSLLSLSLHFFLSTSTSNVYIVYLGLKHANDPVLLTNYHIRLLSDVFNCKEDAEESILYSYKQSFSGFSAMLNSSQASTLARKKGVISVFRSRTQVLHTTRSWDFMGLSSEVSSEDHDKSPLQLTYGSDVVVGIFDTGIWPNSPSFKKEPGIGPIPSTWKGKCVNGENFDPIKACNKKLIGARFYLKGIENEEGPLNATSEYRSPLDFLGHGTHTASTAVGSVVRNASFYNFAPGTARGGAPRARLAVYKVCWGDSNYNGRCTDADIMAAFDDALSDGVNVISASFGPGRGIRTPFYESVADIGSFHAMQLGVSVVFSGGNDGPDPGFVGNVNPWSICVAASNIDRTFPTQITIDHKLSFTGEGLINKPITGKLVGPRPYFFGGVCTPGNWRNRTATGRIFVCLSTEGPVSSVEAQLAVRRANASGLIFIDILMRQIVDVDIIPTVLLDFIQGTQIANYLGDSIYTPTVEISASKTVIGKSTAPVVAYFSSRGPSSLSPDILKPDITAPGVSILAAWPPKTPPSSLPIDLRSTDWNFVSGTSMSCPHVTGVVALIKSAHPTWSPAAIRSAIMTTAYTKDNTCDHILAGGSMKMSDPFDIGSGHLNPLRALDPGLIYDLTTNDYILYLCNSGYTQDQINQIVLISPCTITTICPKSSTNADLNYPSIMISNLKSLTTIKRTITNVGHKKTAMYFAKVISPNGVEISVWPRVLIFTCFKEQISYHVSFKPVKRSTGRYDFGEIVWSDGFHFVRSPLVVFVNTTDNVDHSNI